MTREEYARLLEVMNAKLDALNLDYACFTQHGDKEPIFTLGGACTFDDVRQIAEWLKHLSEQRPR